VKLLARFGAALLSGGALAQVYGLHPLWWLAWLAPIPLLVAAMGASRLTSFLLGAIAGALSVAGLLSYLLGLAGPGPVAFIVTVQALLWGVMAFAVRGATTRLPALAAAFMFPALLAAIETITAQTSPHGSASSLAYSQMDFLYVIQMAAIGGAPAVTFIVVLFASGAALAIYKRRAALAFLPGLIVLVALVWGWHRPQSGEPGRPTDALRVALLADDRFAGLPQDWRPVWSGYLAEVSRAADAGERLVVLPEKIAVLNAAERDAALQQFADLARQRDMVIVLGVDVADEGGRYNRAYVFRPEAETLHYDKRHMVPGLESYFRIGAGPLTFEHGATRFGVAICKDMDFPALSRGYPGARVMLVPSWDFGVDAWLHGRMAVLRGVENGFTIVRSARDGLMTVSDRYGRVLAQAPSAQAGSLRALAPLGSPGPTLYERLGDAFGWASTALALLLIALSLASPPRAVDESKPAAPEGKG